MIKALQRNSMDNSYFSNSADNFSTELSQSNEFATPTENEFFAFPQAMQLNDLVSGITTNSSSMTNNNRNDNGVTVTGNTFNIRKDSDINEIAFKLFELMMDSNANYAGA